jgi:hydrogenase nickel incorporation protein HypA/HybF
MHEMSLAESMMALIENAAIDQSFSKVRAVWLEIGTLSCVEPEALRFCFEAVARDTVAEGARLEIVAVPGEGRCRTCGHNQPMQTLLELCEKCGGYELDISGGTLMRVKELDVV